MEQHDRWREQYLRNYHKADWNDPLLYHLTINTGKVDVGAAVDLIVGCVRRASESRAASQEWLVASRAPRRTRGDPVARHQNRVDTRTTFLYH